MTLSHFDSRSLSHDQSQRSPPDNTATSWPRHEAKPQCSTHRARCASAALHDAFCFGVAFFSWHLPKVLIRKSAIRARSGASTLKDQYLGQVPGGENTPRKPLPSLILTFHWSSRGHHIGDGHAMQSNAHKTITERPCPAKHIPPPGLEPGSLG